MIYCEKKEQSKENGNCTIFFSNSIIIIIFQLLYSIIVKRYIILKKMIYLINLECYLDKLSKNNKLNNIIFEYGYKKMKNMKNNR